MKKTETLIFFFSFWARKEDKHIIAISLGLKNNSFKVTFKSLSCDYSGTFL